MSLSQIEAELDQLTPEELRRLALRSWTAFVKKEGGIPHECNEDDPTLLAEVVLDIQAGKIPRKK